MSSLPPFLKRLLLLGIRLTVFVALLAYVLTRVHPWELQHELMRSDWRLILVGILFASVQIPIAAYRWVLILRDLGVRLRMALAVKLIVIGLFLGQVLPGAAAGDAVRVWLTMKIGCGIKDAINSIAIDRLLMLAVLFLLVALTMLGLPDLPALAQRQWVAPLLLVATLGGAALVAVADRLPAFLRRWRVFRAIGWLAVDARTVLLNWRSGPFLLILSVVSYLNMCGSMYLFALALSQNVDLLTFFLLSLPILLVGILPISIGGWGTREVTAITLMGTIGIEPSSAVLISVLIGVSGIIISLPGAFFLLLDTSQRRVENAHSGTGDQH